MSLDERVHLATCTLCLHVFKLCLLVDRAEELEDRPTDKAS